jgi:hypothetical protein
MKIELNEREKSKRKKRKEERRKFLFVIYKKFE